MGETIKEKAACEFKNIIDNYILPMFSNVKSVMTEFEIDRQRVGKSLIEIDSDLNKLKFYSARQDPAFCIEVSMSKTFHLPARRKVAEDILQEILFISPYRQNFQQTKKRKIKNILKIDPRAEYYKNINYDAAIELGICQYLGGFSIYRLISKLEKWALRTYEGKKVPFCFLVDVSGKIESDNKSKVNFTDFLENKHSAVFTDGMTSCIILDKEGNIIDYTSFSKLNATNKFQPEGKRNIQIQKIPYAPYRFSDICNAAAGRIGIVLQTNGDILIFKHQELFCARISGSWKVLNLPRIVEDLCEFLKQQSVLEQDMQLEKRSKEILLSLLDVSFAHTGGCLAVVSDNKKVKDMYKNDSFSMDENKRSSSQQKIAGNDKIKIIQKFIKYNNEGVKFEETDRKLRQEILALDGATIINLNGAFRAAGAIVKVAGGSNEGGRLAAAKALSKYGLAIKISADGNIVGLKDEEEVFCIF